MRNEYTSILENVYHHALEWQSKMSQLNYAFSEYSTNLQPSVDSVSLHVDLAYMLDYTSWVPPYIEWLLSRQDVDTGFFYETFTEDELRDHPHPRVKEMVGTYLGFQVSSLLLRISRKAECIKFWDFLAFSENALEQYLDDMPWSISPWGAGGWVDSLGTMIYANAQWKKDGRYDQMFRRLLRWITDHQSSETGLWGSPKIQGVEGQINGAYHLLRGTYYLAGKDTGFDSLLLYDTLLDYCKSSPRFFTKSADACNDLDASFLLYNLSKKHKKFRRDEVEGFAKQRLDDLLESRNNDGLYGFFVDRSQDYHNYHFVGPSMPGVSDIQGIVFYLSTIYFLIRIVDQDVKVPWKPSFSHG